jgi:hypothetical protein
MITTVIAIIVIFLIFRFLRNLTIFTMGSRMHPKEDIDEPVPPPAPKANKMINKDEGEYVDYEELKD